MIKILLDIKDGYELATHDGHFAQIPMLQLTESRVGCEEVDGLQDCPTRSREFGIIRAKIKRNLL